MVAAVASLLYVFIYCLRNGYGDYEMYKRAYDMACVTLRGVIYVMGALAPPADS